MFNKYKVVTDLDNVNEKLYAIFDSIDEEKYNVKEYPEGWSPADLAEHLWLLDKRTINHINGDREPTKREPDSKIEQIKSIFLNLDNRRVAPESVSPGNSDKNFKDIYTELKKSRQDLLNLAGTKDLSLLCVGFEHKTLGIMTLGELIYVIIYHTERHIVQLNRIISSNSLQKAN